MIKMTKEVNGLLKDGEHCDQETTYFMCKQNLHKGVKSFCPYYDENGNHQNECPHNAIKR